MRPSSNQKVRNRSQSPASRQIAQFSMSDMPGLQGAEVEALYRSGAAWLNGDAVDR